RNKIPMISVVIPVHNEAALLGGCLEAIERAARDARLESEPVEVVVVLDACTDRSAAIAVHHRAQIVSLDAHCVGAARALGASFAMDSGARWIAFTDADTIVPADSLSAQMAAGTMGQRRRSRPRVSAARLARDVSGRSRRHRTTCSLTSDVLSYTATHGAAPLVGCLSPSICRPLDRSAFRCYFAKTALGLDRGPGCEVGTYPEIFRIRRVPLCEEGVPRRLRRVSVRARSFRTPARPLASSAGRIGTFAS